MDYKKSDQRSDFLSHQLEANHVTKIDRFETLFRYLAKCVENLRGCLTISHKPALYKTAKRKRHRITLSYAKKEN